MQLFINSEIQYVLFRRHVFLLNHFLKGCNFFIYLLLKVVYKLMKVNNPYRIDEKPNDKKKPEDTRTREVVSGSLWTGEIFGLSYLRPCVRLLPKSQQTAGAFNGHQKISS